MRSTLYCLIPLLLALPASLAAQTTLDSVAGQLQAGQRLRIHIRGGQRLEGRFAAYADAPPALRLSAADTLIPVGMIDSLWVGGRAAKSGAIIGAVVVGVPSGVLLGVVCVGLSEGEGCHSWGTVAAFTLAGACAGALLGAAIGSAFPRWHLRYAPAAVGLRLTPLPEHRVGVGVSLQFRTRLR